MLFYPFSFLLSPAHPYVWVHLFYHVYHHPPFENIKAIPNKCTRFLSKNKFFSIIAMKFMLSLSIYHMTYSGVHSKCSVMQKYYIRLKCIFFVAKRRPTPIHAQFLFKHSSTLYCETLFLVHFHNLHNRHLFSQ